MTKRYREAVTVELAAPSAGDGTDLPARDAHLTHGAVPPAGFTWRGGRYQVLAVLGHWREDATYWAGGGIEVPQRDLWRVEAQNGSPSRGIYELVAEDDAWRLDRVWD